MLVLAVKLDQVITEPLEQGHGDGGVVDERAVAAPARELAPHDELAVFEREPRLVQDVRHRTARLDVEDRFHGGRLGVGPDHVGLGAGAPHQQDRVDEHGLASAGLAGEHVEAGAEGDGDGLDDGEVPDAQLAQHRNRC